MAERRQFAMQIAKDKAALQVAADETPCRVYDYTYCNSLDNDHGLEFQRCILAGVVQ